MMLDRRQVLGSALAASFVLTTGARAAEPDLAAIARGSGGRLGVFALDTGSGRHIGIDAGSRYALCSTFKAALAAAVLHAIEAGKLTLDTPLRFTDADVFDYAPAVKKHLDRHELTVEQACAAAVEWSDNSAANLLLAQIGGPAGLTRFIRRAGDTVTRLDHTEPLLNRVAPGDVHDTTTPAAMVGLMRALLLGRVLHPDSRKRLIGWMRACQTGKTKLRAGLPSDWRVGDKTGNSGDGKVNDIAIAWPPRRAPILIASYLDAPKLSPAAADAIHADVGRVIARAFA
jgi:beta-lactamase class A